ncbi:MAG: glycosyltransferase [Prevotella sp.]|nr:glycosyltransferase [Prevotella sp.]
MLNILHIYDEGDSMAAHYVAMLSAALAGKATMSKATTSNSFRELIRQQSPDIVHVHGKSTFPLPPHLRIVVTPHGNPLTITNAYVVVARSQMERQQLSPENHRVEMVLNPIITRSTTPDICGKQMLDIYTKVMNSSVYQLMDSDTKHALSELLCAAICGDRRWVNSQAQHPDYYLLCTYAEREGVLQLVERGAHILAIDIPRQQQTECYLPDGFKLPQARQWASISDLLNDIKVNGPSLLRLAEMAMMLRDEHLDEGKLLNQLEDKHQESFLAAVLPLVQEQTMLTEGFMPCEPQDNTDTQRLRTQLYNRQTVV